MKLLKKDNIIGSNAPSLKLYTMAIITLVYQNHIYVLPNKFLENIQSLTPLVCDCPVIEKVSDKYNIGTKIAPLNICEIGRAIEAMKNDKALYSYFMKNLEPEKKDLCWENERKILHDAYAKYFHKKRSYNANKYFNY